ncbi:MAG: peptide ABC transporter substrate-binding protein [Candidatus Dormibacteria bacterium]
MSLVTVAACGSGTAPSSSGSLAKSQVLRFPTYQDPHTWDPGAMDAEVDTEFAQNVFDNLWRFDDNLNLVSDIASAVPTASNGGISADGQTYTIHLKQNVTFANGDKMTAKDVLYSWDRAVALNGPYASSLGAIAGYTAVHKAGAAFCSKKADPSTCRTTLEQKLSAQDPTLQMSGLTAPDPYTVQVKLTSGCGWCLTAWTLQGSAGSIVDENVIKNDPVNWWAKPCGTSAAGNTDCLLGTGPFFLSAYTPKQSDTWKAVSSWWGSPKPTLTEIDVDIKDPSAQSTTISSWEQGGYDLVGYGGNSILPVADVLRVQANSQEASQVLIKPKGRTTWMSFNIGYPGTGGPFVGQSAAAKGLREAFDLAVDKQSLADTVCKGNTAKGLCTPATGGLITKGLIGYGGDNSDPLAKFDATQAKSLLKQYDPAGTLTANLKYSYNTGGLNDSVASFLQGQWQKNLGLNVALDPNPDGSAFIAARLAGKYVMERDGWQFDYNHPQDWFDNLWGTSACGANTSGYADNGSCGDGATDTNKTYDDTLAKADTEPIDTALSLYNQLSKGLQDDWAYIPLYYSVASIFIHSYVKGAGTNAQADYYWDEISIQSH